MLFFTAMVLFNTNRPKFEDPFLTHCSLKHATVSWCTRHFVSRPHQLRFGRNWADNSSKHAATHWARSKVERPENGQRHHQRPGEKKRTRSKSWRWSNKRPSQYVHEQWMRSFSLWECKHICEPKCHIHCRILMGLHLCGARNLCKCVHSTAHLARVTHAKHFFVCGSRLHCFWIISRNSHSQSHGSYRTRNVHGLNSAQHSVSALSSEQGNKEFRLAVLPNRARLQNARSVKAASDECVAHNTSWFFLTLHKLGNGRWQS